MPWIDLRFEIGDSPKAREHDNDNEISWSLRCTCSCTWTAFNLACGVQFFTPLIITMVAGRYGLGGGISLAAFFAVFTGAWVWTLPETRGTKITPA